MVPWSGSNACRVRCLRVVGRRGERLCGVAFDERVLFQAASTSSGSSANLQDQQGVYVLEKDKQGKFRAHFVLVKTGITGATDIEVLSGLKEGDEIVTGPYKTLRGLKENALLKRDTAKPATPAPNNS